MMADIKATSSTTENYPHDNPIKPATLMNLTQSITRTSVAAILAIFSLVFTGCNYEVPITAEPTRKIEEKLLGDWKSGDEGETSKMKVRKLDDSTYIVVFDGSIFRAYHSDVSGTPFLSVQDIDSQERTYAYFTWSVSEDGNNLILRGVRDKVVSNETKDSAAIQKLLKDNLKNPELLAQEGKFTKEKPVK